MEKILKIRWAFHEAGSVLVPRSKDGAAIKRL